MASNYAASHLLKWDCVFCPLLGCEDRTLGSVDSETVEIVEPPLYKGHTVFLSVILSHRNFCDMLKEKSEVLCYPDGTQ